MRPPSEIAMTSFASTLRRAEVRAPQAPTEIRTPNVGQAERPQGPDFADRLGEMIREVNHEQVEAQEASSAYANGERNDLHGTMLALEQADITLRLVSNIRGRLIDAYREVMRMGT